MNWLNTVLRTRVVSLGASKRLPLSSFQSRVRAWVIETFGKDFADNKRERDDRFMEEAIELYQALGNPVDHLWTLAQYVYSREAGDPRQELGGVQTTLAALSEAHGLDMVDARETELARIWTKVEAIRAKAATKPKNSPLPGHYSGQTSAANNWKPTAAELDSACYSYRHDFGLLSKDEQDRVRATARYWLEAWLKEMPQTPALRMPPASVNAALHQSQSVG